MATDPLSDILRLTEARTVMAGGIAASGPWALRFPPPGEIKFSVLARGSCEMRLEGQKRVLRGEPGDVLLLPGRQGFVVGSSLKVPPRDALPFFARKQGPLSIIGEGTECLILAGGVVLHPASADLLRDALPPVIHVKGSAPQAAIVRWIVEQLLEERARTTPGTEIAASALAQLLFVQVLRAHLATAPSLPAGWLRAVHDERLAAALRRMHDAPSRDWKLQELAKAAAMSRTTFATHFKRAAGMAPLQYLARWRMRLAQRQLRDEDAAVSEIAASLGYSSESAFSQAFKRVTGVRPRDYREEARR
ncbi:cupin domain-containing protein [Corallococcus sp. RDP092CA]|uniref:AraC family transcriptional regulator n=1 Tax=Corallococcus sp. RDP092CA TaxID=3109369 RepID=UPI0035B2B63D